MFQSFPSPIQDLVLEVAIKIKLWSSLLAFLIFLKVYKSSWYAPPDLFLESRKIATFNFFCINL